ncbi:galectin-1-like [Vombatus ursinus]|uniref:galectin-1-like n=1 Tax=Vombatus ursinus TaxID=29139 RepID=UPI000FFDA210|nr:galectin-1-like [Vombatus ursinus]
MTGKYGEGKKLFFKDLNLQPGVCIRVVGYILPDAKHFSVRLGKNDLNFGLNFNLRFSAYSDTNVIVYNYCTDGYWCQENRDPHLPFVPGSRGEISITFEGNNFVARLSDGYQINYPNHLDFQTLNYLETTGDIKLKILDFE